MQKSQSNVSGVPSLILKHESGRGVVVITDKKRTGLPEAIENGAHFAVFPFGQECGVMISQTAVNRQEVLFAGGHAPGTESAGHSDEELLMRAAWHYLERAVVTCAELDPCLVDTNGSPLLERDEQGDGAARLAAAREFSRIAGEALYRRLANAKSKHENRIVANARRKSLLATLERQNREKKLVKEIARFRRVPGGPSYLHYLQLRVRGAGDVFSQMDDATILQRSGTKHILEVRRWLSDRAEITAALRWILRGLSPNMAIRKVIADSQERNLASGALTATHVTTYKYVR